MCVNDCHSIRGDMGREGEFDVGGRVKRERVKVVGEGMRVKREGVRVKGESRDGVEMGTGRGEVRSSFHLKKVAF